MLIFCLIVSKSITENFQSAEPSKGIGNSKKCEAACTDNCLRLQTFYKQLSTNFKNKVICVYGPELIVPEYRGPVFRIKCAKVGEGDVFCDRNGTLWVPRVNDTPLQFQFITATTTDKNVYLLIYYDQSCNKRHLYPTSSSNAGYPTINTKGIVRLNADQQLAADNVPISNIMTIATSWVYAASENQRIDTNSVSTNVNFIDRRFTGFGIGVQRFSFPTSQTPSLSFCQFFVRKYHSHPEPNSGIPNWPICSISHNYDGDMIIVYNGSGCDKPVYVATINFISQLVLKSYFGYIVRSDLSLGENTFDTNAKYPDETRLVINYVDRFTTPPEYQKIYYFRGLIVAGSAWNYNLINDNDPDVLYQIVNSLPDTTYGF